MKCLLLHVCCAPCSTSVIERLKQDYDVTLFFYNPNIEPIQEYEKRLNAAERYAKKVNLPIIVGDYDNTEWHNAVKGYESEPEGGKRCSICFRFNLQKTANLAKKKDFDFFTTTLTVSPYKNTEIINKIGKKIDSERFLEKDFKKENGYTHSIKLSKEHNLYRQDYCGCLYSR